MTLYDRILNGRLIQCSGRIRWTGRRSIVRIAAVDFMEIPFLKASWSKMAPVRPATGVVSALWVERDGAVQDGVLGFECRTGDIRDGDPGASTTGD